MLILRTFRAAIAAWWNDNALHLGASVAYYSLFAIAPVLLIAVAVAGTLFGAEAVRGHLSTEIQGMVGQEAAEVVEGLLEGSAKPASNWLAMIAGTLTMVLAAAGAFLELRSALNTVWRVPSSPIGGLRRFWFSRVRSFGLVLAIGFLLLVSLAVSAALAALQEWLSSFDLVLPLVLQAVSLLLTLLVSTVLFALMFKVLPDVKLSNRDVAVGALMTSILFALGKQLIGLYLGRTAVSSSYGAAGSVVVLLLWVYYSSQIVLIGAEFTRLYADRGKALENRPA